MSSDIYTDLIYDYVHNKCKIDPNSVYAKTVDKIHKPPKPKEEEMGMKDIFYDIKGGSLISNQIDLCKNRLDEINEIENINLSYETHIISILQSPPFNSIYNIDELINILPYLSKYSTNVLNYSGPIALNNYLRQYSEVISSALKDRLGREIIEKVLPLGRWIYINDIESKNMSVLMDVDNIYYAIAEYLFLSNSVQRTIPRQDILIEAAKQISRQLSKWMYNNKNELLPDGTILYKSINEYGKQYMNEFNKTFEILQNSRNFFNPIENILTNSQIISNWDDLDIFTKYIISIPYSIPVSRYEIISLALLLKRPIIIFIGYKSQLFYTPINTYTYFKYDRMMDIPICLIRNSENKYNLLWFNHYGKPSISLISYPTTKNQIVHNERKPIRLRLSGSSKYIIDKEPYNLMKDIENQDKTMTYDLPEFLKYLETSNLIGYIPTKTEYQGGSIVNENTYKIGKFMYTGKVKKIDELAKKKLQANIKNATTPINVYLYMKYGILQLFNLSTKEGQSLLNKAYKEGYIIRL
jgi:hypothetical protein